MTIEVANTAVFEGRKSSVRSYCLSVAPYVAPNSDITRGSSTRDVDAGEYIDFRLARIRCMTGKDDPNLRSALTEYLMRPGNKTAAPVRTAADRPVIETEANGDKSTSRPAMSLLLAGTPGFLLATMRLESPPAMLAEGKKHSSSI